ncbi:hypothetical protein HYPSUDRAFT_41847 [Hypholoma sublateritium FD-334 SS-4]|uniref:F-box domain-containing protein n=1 Tax=Hypholoma sublateritium (strain FD-334 SS-4) TaxID=945553 RepID=A0A0D2PPB2_HYPSF|nr:hypothetical protein HYPSUDRAFT_41847 [Hypholoma sublateritium FD-334 SS-4]
MYDPAQTLPHDVLALIADQLASENFGFSPDTATLRALSQTCKFMVAVCRRYLFAEIRLDCCSEVHYKTLMDLLREKIETASYVRELYYAVQEVPDKHLDGILEALLGHSIFLRHIYFERSMGQWSKQPESIQRVLTSLIQLPTVTCLRLSDIQDFPVNHISLCGGLKILSLTRITDFALHDVSSFPAGWTVPTPLSLEIMTADSFGGLAIIMGTDNGPNALAPIVDFGRLQHAHFDMQSDPAAVNQVCKILKTAQQLKSIKLNVDDKTDAVRLSSLGPVLAAHTPSTLTSITIESEVEWRENETTLWGLDKVLQDMAGRNVLAWLDLFIVITTGDQMQQFMDLGDLLDLDRVLTEPGAFPALRSVAFELRWNIFCAGYYFEDDEDDDEDDFVDHGRVTREDFPRLCDFPGVKFSFSESDD